MSLRCSECKVLPWDCSCPPGERGALPPLEKAVEPARYTLGELYTDGEVLECAEVGW